MNTGAVSLKHRDGSCLSDGAQARDCAESGALVLDKIRKKLNQSGGLGAGIAAVVVLLVLVIAFVSFRSATGPSLAAQNASQQPFICTETHKLFFHTLKPGEKLPIYSSYSGKNTAYPADQCWWTKDGKLRSEPFYFLRNSYLGKRGPTFCPDCGRLFDPYLGAPAAGMKPPPTRDEYAKSHHAPTSSEE
jgi:hypothetical protein